MKTKKFAGGGNQNQSKHQKDREDWKRELEQNFHIDDQVVHSLIRQGGQTLVETAETLGPLFEAGGLTTNQIRNIFGMVKRMEMSEFNEIKHEFILLKPKLAYAEARANKKGAYQFREVMTWAIEEVIRGQEGETTFTDADKATKFERFVDFFEAILAYHKAAGGK
jgi:CRISPR-associated protein Csm2